MTTNPPAATPATAAGRAAARRSFEALALGDAFGERWFPLSRAPRQAVNEIRARRTPPEPRWHWTDDTALALALTRSLDERGHVDQDHLALCYALAFDADQARGELTLDAVAERTPEGLVRDGVRRAARTPFSTEPWRAADLLGNGQRIRADDTVPFALWSAARHGDDLEAALWATAAGLGDVDTTCAITGGVVGAATGTAGAPEAWLRRREPLTENPFADVS
ncbi:ADP-ribosylglycohydrolase family protein [Streptomyces fimicarius]|uniref:ADP-ribosylglycohydrolase family protein n=1 Tax=Streptomyces griseus TaxID=1911 RepID=UPI003681BD67